MIYETKTRKGFDGWRAESIAELGDTPAGKRMLELVTSKKRGGLGANANVYIYKPDGVRVTEIFGDFYKGNIAFTPCHRVTEKAVLEVHSLALQEMDNLIEQAKAFYTEREAAA